MRQTADLMHLVCRIALSSQIPPELSRQVAEKLLGLEQQIGLLVPKPLPELPQVPLELLPSVVTTMGLQYAGEGKFSLQQYEAAKAW